MIRYTKKSSEAGEAATQNSSDISSATSSSSAAQVSSVSANVEPFSICESIQKLIVDETHRTMDHPLQPQQLEATVQELPAYRNIPCSRCNRLHTLAGVLKCSERNLKENGPIEARGGVNATSSDISSSAAHTKKATTNGQDIVAQNTTNGEYLMLPTSRERHMLHRNLQLTPRFGPVGDVPPVRSGAACTESHLVQSALGITAMVPMPSSGTILTPCSFTKPLQAHVDAAADWLVRLAHCTGRVDRRTSTTNDQGNPSFSVPSCASNVFCF